MMILYTLRFILVLPLVCTRSTWSYCARGGVHDGFGWIVTLLYVVRLDVNVNVNVL
jgi:hypothetical protein